MISPSKISCLFALGSIGAVSFLSAQITFSTDAPSAVLHAPADLVGPGPVMILKGSSAGVEVDAFSYGRTMFVDLGPTDLFFSVTPGSAGAPGSAVAIEAGKGGDEPSDVYAATIGSGTNSQIWDGDGSSAGLLGIPEPFSSNVDALDMRPAIPPVMFGMGAYWSIDPASTTLLPYLPGGGTAADIWFSPPVVDYADMPALYAPAVSLGLGVGDDINALVVFEDGSAGFSPATDVVFLSLATGSPTLGVLGVGPEDILAVGGGAPLALAISGASIGLIPGDDLNALDFEVIPEPALAPFLVGLFLLLRPGRRRRR